MDYNNNIIINNKLNIKRAYCKACKVYFISSDLIFHVGNLEHINASKKIISGNIFIFEKIETLEKNIPEIEKNKINQKIKNNNSVIYKINTLKNILKQNKIEIYREFYQHLKEIKNDINNEK